MIMRKAIIHIAPAIGHNALFVIGLALAPLPALASRPSGAVSSCAAVASTAVSAAVPVASPAENITQKDYEDLVRRLFHQGQWKDGKKVLDEGLSKYESNPVLNMLLGYYWLHHKQYDRARYYLIRSLREDDRDPQTLQLLLKVEEQTKHYSSAIVYCNELLELSPYDYDLWRKKISLFRQQGNEVEAERLLKRLEEIYPDRAEVKREMAGDYETRYRNYRKHGNLTGQETMLRQLVSIQPNNAEFQMALCNLLAGTGRTEDAIDVAGHAATTVADPYPFVAKKASILGGMTRYGEALAYLKEASRANPRIAGRITALSNELEREQARYAAQTDPYTAYGRLYEKEHSDEALTYLLNTSMSRGYLDDALHYIREARRRRGDTKNLMYREYTVERRLGNTRAATAMLEKIHARWPNDADINEELCAMQLEEARRMMDFRQWDEAVALLERLAGYKVDRDTHDAVVRRLFTCYIQAGRRQKALGLISAISDSPRTRAELYEEVMTPYIKQLMAQGMARKAEEEIQQVLDKGYPSADLLGMAITTELTLRHQDEARSLVERGKTLYPDNPYFRIKEAQLAAAAGDYARAYTLLGSMVGDYLGDSAVVKAYAECCEQLARREMKAGHYDDALSLIDHGLETDPGNQPLILAKSEVYEKLRDWDNAIATCRLYHPSYAEFDEWNARLNRLRRHLLRNTVTVDYQRARPSGEDNITSQASAAYSRVSGRNTYTAGLTYVGRDGLTEKTDSTDAEGGNGLQLSGEWQRQWSRRLTTTLSAAVATKFMPKLRLGIGGSYAFDHDWTGTANLSYRLFDDSQKGSLVEAGAGATKDLEPFSLGANAHVFYMTGDAAKSFSSSLFVNGGLTARCYPATGNRSYLYVAGSVGNAPELSLIDNSMPVRFDQLNTMLGAGGLVVISSMIDFGVNGTWYNMSVSNSQSDNTRSRNYLYVDAYVTIHF
jgi:tetratricopeptide (TPR) repeat protein